MMGTQILKKNYANYANLKKIYFRLAMPAENLSIDLTVTFSKSPEFWYGSPAQDTQVLN